MWLVIEAINTRYSSKDIGVCKEVAGLMLTQHCFGHSWCVICKLTLGLCTPPKRIDKLRLINAINKNIWSKCFILIISVAYLFSNTNSVKCHFKCPHLTYLAFLLCMAYITVNWMSMTSQCQWLLRRFEHAAQSRVKWWNYSSAKLLGKEIVSYDVSTKWFDDARRWYVLIEYVTFLPGFRVSYLAALMSQT